jgi:predicted short-subunit dehydrogenase-like oxidoreductase (DUF2520 family)
MSARPRAREGPTLDDPPAGLTVGVVGAGRVGVVLAAALAAAGHRVVAVTAGSRPDRMSALLPATAVLPAAEVARAATHLLLVAVPDDALGPVVTELAAAGALRPGQVVAHPSGAHGLAVLRPAVDRGVRPLALHPAMTFTGDAADLERLAGVSYGVTAPDDLREFAERLVADLGGRVEWVTEPDRALYHAALAHGANHLVTLVNDAADRLREAGVRQPGPMLAPLLRAALENTLRLGDHALTGPVVRGDAGTVDRHLRVLGERAPDALAAYRTLARRTADRAVAAGRLPDPAVAPLRAVLADPGVAEPGRAGPAPAATAETTAREATVEGATGPEATVEEPV